MPARAAGLRASGGLRQGSKGVIKKVSVPGGALAETEGRQLGPLGRGPWHAAPPSWHLCTHLSRPEGGLCLPWLVPSSLNKPHNRSLPSPPAPVKVCSSRLPSQPSASRRKFLLPGPAEMLRIAGDNISAQRRGLVLQIQTDLGPSPRAATHQFETLSKILHLSKPSSFANKMG